ncbi:MAG TPA: chemotaxis-specific protein-glutamate methyltransferase CheB [Candidatus Lustribacter sp.]|nr:chemotaxis-specific protein-glutamate methyltransferase CheB [Candidatus Lustribacter sp.]
MIRLLLVEDSAVQREFLSFILEESGDFEIIATAGDGEEAVQQAGALHPDVILMDCHMPKLDGVGATRIIMETVPAPIVLMTASPAESEQEFTFDAIKNGALAVVSKPPAFGTPDFDRVAGQLVRTVRLMSEVKVVRRWPARTATARAQPAAAAPVARHGVHLVALVGSTGAPAVIAEILTAIGPSTRATFLIVQHMSDGFIAGFAGWLAARSGISTQVAQDGIQTQPGTAYVAPDGAQMGIDANGRITLSTEPDDDGFRPSGNYLLRSVARAFGRNAMGVLLTGMGRDGAAGLLELQRAGGLTVAQDEESSVVFGMPGEAVRLGAAGQVLPPEAIARYISDCTQKS